MRRIIYLSSSVKYLNGEEIKSLLSQCREKNIKTDITGLLLYSDGDFLQVIEGPKLAMLNLFESIKKDPRHHGIITIENTEINKRHFPKWNMGFYTSDCEELRTIKDYENINRETLSNISVKMALAFVDSFIKSHQSKFVFV